MSTGNPTFGQLKQEKKDPILNEQGKEALKDLKLTLEAQRIPDGEKQGYIDRLISKINGKTDKDMIDMTLANIVLDTTKRAKELKLKKENEVNKEGACPQCGAPTGPGYNFCGRCGSKLK